MNKRVFYTVIKKDHAVSPVDMAPAKLEGFKRSSVKDVRYPAAYETGAESDSIHGQLIMGLSDEDIAFLDTFEGSEYERIKVSVILKEGQRVDAFFYNWTAPKSRLTNTDWDDSWLADDEAVKAWLGREFGDVAETTTD